MQIIIDDSSGAWYGFPKGWRYGDSDKEQGIVRDFIWSKMQDDVNKTSDEEKLQNVIQFYAVALYEIPRNTWFRYE